MGKEDWVGGGDGGHTVIHIGEGKKQTLSIRLSSGGGRLDGRDGKEGVKGGNGVILAAKEKKWETW